MNQTNKAERVCAGGSDGSPIYVASRASVPERGQMWRKFREQGVEITSTWIDEDGAGQTEDWGELWERIGDEIEASNALVLYAEKDDFPLKGALIEVGIALGLCRSVVVCLPGMVLPDNYRPIGSWITHPLVTRVDDINAAIQLATGCTFPGTERVERHAFVEFEGAGSAGWCKTCWHGGKFLTRSAPVHAPAWLQRVEKLQAANDESENIRAEDLNIIG